MSICPKLRTPLLAVALATAMASAWATYEIGHATYVPRFRVEAAPAANAPIAPSGALEHRLAIDANETIVTVEEPAPRMGRLPTEAAPLPAAEPLRGPSITITEARLTEDQRIQAELMELLAGHPMLSGRIGVEADGRVVRLSGWTMTSGQSRRAELTARAIRGVRHVVNEIRPRLGPIRS